MREPGLLSSDLFVTTISDQEGLHCFLYPVRLTADFRFFSKKQWPILMEERLDSYLRNKIILEINNGQQIFYKICEYCFAELSQSTGFVCVPCYKKNSKAYN